MIVGIFWAAVLVLGYTYLGYPALLALFAWLRPRPPIVRGLRTPTVTVLLVAHNEETRLAAKLRNCLELAYPRENLEILVVSDGSTDSTEDIASSFAGQGIHLLRLPGPHGKAAAIARALPECRGEIIVLCDARQELAEDSLAQLVAAFADPSVGAVSGELHLRVGDASAAGPGLGAYWSYEKAIRRLESVVDSVVGATGALYAVRRELLKPPDPATILDDVAIPMGVVRGGYRVVIEPAARVFDDTSGDDSHEFARKVRTLAGNYQLVALEPGLLWPRSNRLFWQFASHKLARLAVPWCLLLLVLSSIWQSFDGHLFYQLTLLAQTGFYAMAMIGWVLGRLRRRMAFFSVPYAFVMLNLAAGVSLIAFLAGTQRAGWKAAS
jgi:cellulose synthase/poly-beta-1,6-N-acetylglucosamine synthase-like glycosyltransferase